MKTNEVKLGDLLRMLKMCFMLMYFHTFTDRYGMSGKAVWGWGLGGLDQQG